MKLDELNNIKTILAIRIIYKNEEKKFINYYKIKLIGQKLDRKNYKNYKIKLFSLKQDELNNIGIKFINCYYINI